MRKNIAYTFTLLSLLTLNINCNAQEEENTTPKIISEKYEPCCSSEDKVNYDLDGFKLFMPNVFTPNGDGINDLFYPIFDQNNDKQAWVGNFVIYNSNVDSIKRSVFFTQQLFYNDLKTYAWDGKQYISNEKPLHKGQFWYSFELYFDNKVFFIKGSGCSIICDEEAPIFKDKEGCFFPAQVKSDFNGDGTLPNGERDCFK